MKLSLPSSSLASESFLVFFFEAAGELFAVFLLDLGVVFALACLLLGARAADGASRLWSSWRTFGSLTISKTRTNFWNASVACSN